MKRSAAGILLACALHVHAQPKLDDARAIYALNLFSSACMQHLGNPDQTSAWAGLEQLPSLDEEQVTLFLQGKPGSVWNASGPNGDALLLLTPEGKCSVWARRATASEAQVWVKSVMDHVETTGTRAERMEDRLIEGRGGMYRFVAYRLASPASERQFLVSCTTTESDNEQVLAQVMLSVAEIKPR